MEATHADLAAALAASRFAAATVRTTTSWDGRTFSAVKWSWDNDERAALVDYLRSAGFSATDRAHAVLVADR